jgi:asparagine synthase (glutamine-hydrolysing)
VPEEGGVGLALSGGLDSTLIALTLQRQKVGRVQTFTVGSDPEHQDLQMARATAARLKSEHHEILVGFDDYVRAIPQFVEALERPLLSVGTAFHLLCGSMAGRVSTCLVGEGADQMFGGGVDYLFDKRVREQLTDGMSRAESLGLGVGEETLQIVAELAGPQPYERYLSNLFRRRLADMFAAGSQLYYACSAKFGIEARDPYLSRELFDFLARVPARFKVNQGLKIDKYLLRHAALGMFGPAMIDAVLCQKRGLGGPFRDYAKRFEELCEASVPDAYLAAHRLGRLNLKKHRLILFDLFELIFLEGRGVCPAGLDMFEFIRERAGAAAARRPTSYATDQAQ